MNNLINNKKTDKFLIIFIAIISLLVVSWRVIPNDYWWHIKAGEYIVTNKTIPYIDVFSWVGIKENLQWISHEWLSEVTMYLFAIVFNKTLGGFLFTLFFTTIFLYVVYFTNKEHFNKSYIFTFVSYSIIILTLHNILSPRPHLISFSLFTIVIYILFRYVSEDNYRGIWILPIISILWANFHGGSSNIPYILCIIFIVGHLFDFKIGKIEGTKLPKEKLLTLIKVSVLSILAIMINPHGYKMVLYPYENMKYTLMLNTIAEWRSPDLKIMGDILYVLPVIIMAMVFITIKKNINFRDILLFGAFSYLTLKSVRFSILAFILFIFISKEYVVDDIKNDIADIIGFGLIKGLMVMGIVLSGVLLVTQKPFHDFTGLISDELIETIKEENPQRLYNDYDYGGYLIYEDIKVLIDGRADLYQESIYNDYIAFTKKLNTNLQEKYDFDYYIVNKNSLMNNYLKSNSDEFELVDEDTTQNVLFYKKNVE